MVDLHRGHDEAQGACTGTELCLCACPACGVAARLQILAHVEALEAAFEEMQPGKVASIRRAARDRARRLAARHVLLH